jgi:hypothetical protein
MIGYRFIVWHILRLAALAALAPLIVACATYTPTAPDQLELMPGAVTIPYKISDAGHLILNIRVNGTDAKPFLLDSGANTSAIYDEHASSMGLVPIDKKVAVNGLVASGLRPIAENVAFQIGETTFVRDHVVILERLKSDNAAMGLLGVDVLADYTLQFNKDKLLVTFIPSESVKRGHFSGWRKIPLRNRVSPYPDSGLYFAFAEFTDKKTPVLVDTGSELSIINWPLATMDPNLKRLRRKIIKAIEFEGANESTELRMRSYFPELELGTHVWTDVPVLIMDFDSLSMIAPADKPMMIAGASMFTPSSFAFDFKNNMIYILPEG